MAFELPDALTEVEATLEERGFDLVHPFSILRWNRVAAPEERLPLFGRSDAWGLVIGNSRALWGPFVRWARAQSPRPAQPLDTYSERTIGGAFEQLGVRYWCGYSHHLEPRPLPIQRIADAAGLAPLGPARLNVHPIFGPWMALRAVVALDLPLPPRLPARAPHLCATCPAPCRDALARALSILTPESAEREPTEEARLRLLAEASDPSGAPLAGSPLPPLSEPRDEGPASLPLDERRRRFLRVREVCPVGAAHRYSDEQIVYHYMLDERVFD